MTRVPGRAASIVAVLLVVGGCRKREPPIGFEEEFFAKEVGKLETAVANRDVSGISVGCAIHSTGLDRMPASLTDKITRLCHVEAPRISLEDAIRNVTEWRAKYLNLPSESACIQPFVDDALKTLAAHPPTDPRLTKLLEDYTRLCPETRETRQAREKRGHASGWEVDYAAKELGELETAVAKRDASGISVGCLVTTNGLDRLPASLTDKITRICYIEAPRIYLEDAIKSVTEARAGGLSSETACIQLFVSDAWKALAAHPSTDPTVTKLVDDYTKLCPAAVAKVRAKIGQP
jgi:hypothetical protein